MVKTYLYNETDYEAEFNVFEASLTEHLLNEKLSILNKLQIRNSEKGFSSNYNELELEQSFNERIFNELFDYTSLYRNASGDFEVAAKSNIGREANDFSLGYFTKEKIFVHKASVELKRPNVKDLDRRKTGRKLGQETPVKQAFDFARKRKEFEWIVICNFKKLRIYAVEDNENFLEFDLMTIKEKDQIKRLLFPLQLGAFFTKEGNTGRLKKIKRGQ